MTKRLEIDPWITFPIPPLPESQFEELVAHLRRTGHLQPLVLFQGRVIDGRARLRAYRELKVPDAKIPAIAFTGTLDEACRYVLSSARARRHLTKSQLAMQAAMFSLPVIGDARRNRGDGLAIERAARLQSVNTKYVDRARRILRDHPDIAVRVLAGEFRLDEARDQIRHDRDRLWGWQPSKSIKTQTANNGKSSTVCSKALTATTPVVVDRWLGKIQHGDALELLRQLPDESVNAIITSPPYWKKHVFSHVRELGQEASVEDYLDNLMEVFVENLRVLRPDGSIIWNLGDTYADNSLSLIPFRFAARAVDETGVKLVNVFQWIKQNPHPRPNHRRARNAHEPFLWFAKSDLYVFNLEPTPKGKSRNGNSLDYTLAVIAKSELSTMQKARARKEARELEGKVVSGEIEGYRIKVRGIHSLPWGGRDSGPMRTLTRQGYVFIKYGGGHQSVRDVIETPVENDDTGHPTPFPVAVVEQFIRLATKAGDVVLDPFIGSGSVAVAAEGLGRRWIGMELHQPFVEVARERLKGIRATQKHA